MGSTLDILLSIGKQVRALPDVYDPLASITEIVRAEPHAPRARVLTAILRGLATDKTEFSEADVYALDHEALGLVVLLAHEVLNARYARLELLLHAAHAGRA